MPALGVADAAVVAGLRARAARQAADSNGAVIEFMVAEEGEYILVEHEFADAQKGAVGKIRVGSPTGLVTRQVAPLEH